MKALLALFLALSVLALPATGQEADLDGIIAAHVDARGGIDAIHEIHTLRKVGNSSVFGLEVSVDIRYRTHGKYLQTAVIMDQEILNGTDGTTTWVLNPMRGPDPIVAPDVTAVQMSMLADFIGPLVNAAEKGVTLSYEGTEVLGDVEAHKIVATHDEWPETVYYVHPETYMIIQNVREGANPLTGEPATIVRAFDDYREVAGTMFAFKMALTADAQPWQTVTFESITANEAMSSDLFAMPLALGID